MFGTLLNLTTPCTLLLDGIAHADITVEFTRYPYREGTRKIITQVENKNDIPYLIKSWAGTSTGKAPSSMATPPPFRLEGKQQNTACLFATGSANAPTDRGSMYYFNVMVVPSTDDTKANNNTIQLVVRHRMRLVYRPKTLFDLSPSTEAKKLGWRRAGKRLTVKNPTPFFFYFNSIQIDEKEVKPEVNLVAPMTTKEVTPKKNINAPSITWKVVNDYSGTGSFYSSSL